ncbi:MAG: hypothetical protein IJU40_08485 [Desulfovibrionaceae bacterium]|nr:hypothetical protein [Desulfovibrionaceae bacterium]
MTKSILRPFLLFFLAFSFLISGSPSYATPQIKGKIFKKISFSDQLGQKTVILSHSGIYQTKTSDPEQPNTNGDLYAYGFKTTGDAKETLFTMHDFVHECEVYATAEFAKGSPLVTDLDKNGISEVWIIYYVSCHGDVSPDVLKILMYEGQTKYALRGETFVHVDGMDYGGKYTADPAFKTAPKAFLKYADKLWQKYKHRR